MNHQTFTSRLDCLSGIQPKRPLHKRKLKDIPLLQRSYEEKVRQEVQKGNRLVVVDFVNNKASEEFGTEHWIPVKDTVTVAQAERIYYLYITQIETSLPFVDSCKSPVFDYESRFSIYSPLERLQRVMQYRRSEEGDLYDIDEFVNRQSPLSYLAVTRYETLVLEDDVLFFNRKYPAKWTTRLKRALFGN